MEPLSIEDREARVSEIDARLAEIDAKYANELMPKDARDEWNELNAERDKHAATIAEIRARRQRLADLAQRPGATERVAAPAAPAFIPSRGSEIYDVTQIRQNSKNEDDFHAKLHDNARRAIERAKFPVEFGGHDRIAEHVEDLLGRADDRNGTFAKRILVTGSPVYDRAFGKYLMRGVAALTSEEQRAMSVGGGSPAGSEGGFAVPFQLDPTVILTNDGSTSPLRRIARVEQITGKTWQGITSAGVTVARSAEGAQADDESFTLAQPSVTPTRVTADVRFSVEIDQDWPQLRSEIARILADAKDREEDQSFVMGDGTSNAPNGVVGTLAETSEVELDSAGVLKLADLLELEASLPVRHRSRGQFLANKTTYQAVRGLSENSDGADLWVRLSGSQPPELLGYPAHEASAMESIGTADNRVLLFGDFSQFIIVDKLGMNIEVNPHIVGANGRWTGQRAVVAMWRNSSLILNHNAFRVLVDIDAESS